MNDRKSGAVDHVDWCIATGMSTNKTVFHSQERLSDLIMTHEIWPSAFVISYIWTALVTYRQRIICDVIFYVIETASCCPRHYNWRLLICHFNAFFEEICDLVQMRIIFSPILLLLQVDYKFSLIYVATTHNWKKQQTFVKFYSMDTLKTCVKLSRHRW